MSPFGFIMDGLDDDTFVDDEGDTGPLWIMDL